MNHFVPETAIGMIPDVLDEITTLDVTPMNWDDPLSNSAPPGTLMGTQQYAVLLVDDETQLEFANGLNSIQLTCDPADSMSTHGYTLDLITLGIAPGYRDISFCWQIAESNRTQRLATIRPQWTDDYLGIRLSVEETFPEQAKEALIQLAHVFDYFEFNESQQRAITLPTLAEVRSLCEMVGVPALTDLTQQEAWRVKNVILHRSRHFPRVDVFIKQDTKSCDVTSYLSQEGFNKKPRRAYDYIKPLCGTVFDDVFISRKSDEELVESVYQNCWLKQCLPIMIQCAPISSLFRSWSKENMSFLYKVRSLRQFLPTH